MNPDTLERLQQGINKMNEGMMEFSKKALPIMQEANEKIATRQMQLYESIKPSLDNISKTLEAAGYTGEPEITDSWEAELSHEETSILAAIAAHSCYSVTEIREVIDIAMSNNLSLDAAIDSLSTH